MNDDTRRKLARRLSGALGRKIAEDDLDIVPDDHRSVVLTDGTFVGLLSSGNVAYTDGSWFRNGQRLSEAEADRWFATRS